MLAVELLLFEIHLLSTEPTSTNEENLHKKKQIDENFQGLKHFIKF